MKVKIVAANIPLMPVGMTRINEDLYTSEQLRKEPWLVYDPVEMAETIPEEIIGKWVWHRKADILYCVQKYVDIDAVGGYGFEGSKNFTLWEDYKQGSTEWGLHNMVFAPKDVVEEKLKHYAKRINCAQKSLNHSDREVYCYSYNSNSEKVHDSKRWHELGCSLYFEEGILWNTGRGRFPVMKNGKWSKTRTK